MRLATYSADGRTAHGRLSGTAGDEHIIELGDGDLLGLLRGGAQRLEQARAATGPRVDPAAVRLLAPLRRPPKLLAVAANYQEHIREGGGEPVDKRRIVPRLFLKPSTAVIGPGATLELPRVSAEVDWEVELAVVIGRRCRDVAVERALDAVAGYTIVNDVSARSVDYGIDRDPSDAGSFFDWLQGKWCDGFAPMGPALHTSEEVADPQGLRLGLRVNGQDRQDGHTSDMIFGVAEIIAFASRLMTLEPGDVIATGTPAGVGATSGTYLQPGDEMQAWVEGLGTLTTPVAAPGSTSGSAGA